MIVLIRMYSDGDSHLEPVDTDALPDWAERAAYVTLTRSADEGPTEQENASSDFGESPLSPGAG